jgi:hypothetical protein
VSASTTRTAATTTSPATLNEWAMPKTEGIVPAWVGQRRSVA